MQSNLQLVCVKATIVYFYQSYSSFSLSNRQDKGEIDLEMLACSLERTHSVQ